MAGPAGGRGSSHGIDRAVLEAGVGNAGAVLEAGAPKAGGGQQDVRHAASVPSQVQPRAAWAKERFRRRRTDDQAPRLGYKQAIWAIAHRLCRVLWLILHKGVRYEERGPAVSAKSKRTRAARMIKELQKLGYRVVGGPLPTVAQA